MGLLLSASEHEWPFILSIYLGGRSFHKLTQVLSRVRVRLSAKGFYLLLQKESSSSSLGTDAKALKHLSATSPPRIPVVLPSPLSPCFPPLLWLCLCVSFCSPCIATPLTAQLYYESLSGHPFLSNRSKLHSTKIIQISTSASAHWEKQKTHPIPSVF